MPIIMSGHEGLPTNAATVVERALESAARYLARSEGPSRPNDGRRSQFAASFKALLEWGEANQLIFPSSQFSFLTRPPEGHGDEHEAWFNEPTNVWFKLTYPNRFGLGWNSDETATPTQYVNRLLLQNEHFADRIALLGLIEVNQRMRVLTSQPHVAGDPATCEEIKAWFEGMGYTRVQSDEGAIAWYDPDENLLIADAHEGNVVRTKNNVLVAIDLNLMHPEGETRDWAQEQAALKIQNQSASA